MVSDIDILTENKTYYREGESMIIYILIGFLVAAILMVAEYFLCTKLHSPLWGGIIPILVLVCTIVIFGSGYVSLDWKAILLFIILNTLCFGDWAAGREQYRKNQHTQVDEKTGSL